MSSSEPLSGDGGGGGGDTDTKIIKVTVSDSRIARIARRVVRTLVPNVILRLGATARRILADPRRTIIGIVGTWLLATFVVPVFDAIVTTAELVIQTILVLFLGTDLRLAATGPVGIADAPLWLFETVASAGTPIAAIILSTINWFNASVAGVAAQAGLAAPLVVSVLVVAESLVALYAAWSVLRIVDVPFVQLDGLVSVVVLPIRRLVGVFR